MLSLGQSLTSTTSVGLRCSSFALSLVSPIFKAALAAPITQQAPATDSSASSQTATILPLPQDDGDALLIIVNIIHFRHDKLPAHIQPDTLFRVAILANKYESVHAISRATGQWFDRIFTEKRSTDTLKMVQAAYMLDEAMFFARFTSRYVLTFPLGPKPSPQPQDSGLRVMPALHTRQQEAFAALRVDIDLLVDTCAAALAKENRHFIDFPPDVDPEEGEPKGVNCVVDSQGAPVYLGALRDAKIWPATAWGANNAEGIVQAIKNFREPDYEDCDKCEFCLPLVSDFAEKLKLVRKLEDERLWGLCLDCFKAGGANVNECRYAHVKALVRAALQQPQAQTQN